MSSDHDKAGVLQLPGLRSAIGDQTVRRSLMRAAGSINSDHDKANVLSAILGDQPLPPEALGDVLRVAASIQSDHDKARVLELAVKQDVNQSLPQAAFFSAANTIQSDNDRSRVLKTFIDRSAPDVIVDDLARSAEKISSDNDKANVLSKLASQPVTPAFLSAVRSIQSDSDKRRVIEAMVERNNSVDTAKNGIALAVTISSDHDKVKVLSAIAMKHRDNPEVRDDLRKAAEKISSDSDYRRIVSMLR
jgi:hypothetical protein